MLEALSHIVAQEGVLFNKQKTNSKQLHFALSLQQKPLHCMHTLTIKDSKLHTEFLDLATATTE